MKTEYKEDRDFVPTSNQDIERAVGRVEAVIAHDHHDRGRADGKVCSWRVGDAVDHELARVVHDIEISPRHRRVVLPWKRCHVEVVRASYVWDLSIWKYSLIWFGLV